MLVMGWKGLEGRGWVGSSVTGVRSIVCWRDMAGCGWELMGAAP